MSFNDIFPSLSESAKSKVFHDVCLEDAQGVFKEIVPTLIRFEYHWLMSLPKSTQQRLQSNWDPDKGPFPAHHLLCTPEVAMVLTGVKPCCVVCHGNDPSYGKMWLDNCLMPWYNTYRLAVLKPLGFPVPTLITQGLARYGSHHDACFGGAALFVYERHPLYESVKKVFSSPTVTDGALAKVFGYPSESGNIDITYQIHLPHRDHLLGVAKEATRDMCCTPALQYFLRITGAESLTNVGNHFSRYRKALEGVGIEISLDVDDDSLGTEHFTLIFASAADYQLTVLETLIRGDRIWMRPNMNITEILKLGIINKVLK